MKKKVFIICPVRLANSETVGKLEAYARGLEELGYEVHLPHRDTQQDQSGLDICLQNAHAISAADEIHIFYRAESSGIHFDMGVAFAMDIICGNKKEVVIVENEIVLPGKSFPRFLEEWKNFRVDIDLID